MGSAEGVIDIDIPQSCQGFGEVEVAGFLLGVKAQVLQEQDVTGLAGRLPVSPPPARYSPPPCPPAAPVSAQRRLATGVSRISSTTLPLGRPKWDIRITLALRSRRYLMVGTAARMRLSSVIAPVLASSGTLKSTLTSTLLPATSISLTVILCIFRSRLSAA